MKPPRQGLEDVAMEALQPGIELSRQQMRALLKLDGGDLSRLMERLAHRQLVTVRREKPPGLGCPRCFYRRFDGVEYTPKPKKPKKATPLPVVLARVKASAEPMPPPLRFASIFHLGASMADVSPLKASA